MKFAVKKPGEGIQVVEVEPVEDSCYAFLNKTVGGYIEHSIFSTYNPDVNINFYCNEEGKLNDLPNNFYLANPDGEIYDIVVGTAVFVGEPDEEGNDTSLTDEQIAVLTKTFGKIE